MKRLLSGLLFLLLSSTVLAQEATTASGWTLLDQFDKPYTANAELRIVLIARDMTGSKLVKSALDGRPAGYLEARHGVFVADISRMPGAISAMFAVPAMRDYSYRVLLDRDARIATRFSAQPEVVTWLQVEQGRVVDTRRFDNAEALRQALERGTL
ncbi:FAD/FMN-containing dehydrogenase [Pseudomonas sp. NY15181]|uniref:FAD/FMN-containing dehydrogenase n=1 Tax=Pseudomonas sp. NY15181 TaxID=3400349 RepID=UPI003A8843EF